ncbi:YcaO-like family protein [Dongia sp. agr-C8]
MAPFFKELGITRVGDLTGLDTIGIPVWFASRPNARTLAVSQGKGIRHVDARTGAVMEAVEDAVAERSGRNVAMHASCEQLRRRQRVIPFERITRCSAFGLDPRADRAWVPGLSLPEGQPVFAPFELVGLDFSTDSPWDHRAFRMSSVGLAAGGTLCEAVIHGLLEIIEHAATSSLDIFGIHPAFARPVRFRAGDCEALDHVQACIRRAGVEPIFLDISRNAAFPVVAAFIDRPVVERNGRCGSIFSAGFAAKPTLAGAALAALLEAVQSRLTDIAGARDDLQPEQYRARHSNIGRLRGCGPEIPATAAPQRQGIAAQLRALLAGLAEAGIGEIFVFPLDCGEMDVRVVRVIATECETPGDGNLAVLDSRTLEKILEPGR